MGNEQSAELHYQAQTLMKTFFLFFTLLIFSLSFGQTKKGKTTPKTTVVKEIPLEERTNIIKSDPDSDAALDVEHSPVAVTIRKEENTIYKPEEIEVQPEFPGGSAKLLSFISKNFEYSEDMKENELKGKVIVSFIIERNGNLTNLKVIRSIGYGTDNEAMRVVTKMPKWLPGEQNGKKVRCSYLIPITIDAAKQ